MEGNAVYEKLTPSWLRGDAAFRHSHDSATSILCEHGFLPRKSSLKNRSKRDVKSAIIAYWVQHESSTSSRLRWYLEKSVLRSNITISRIETSENNWSWTSRWHWPRFDVNNRWCDKCHNVSTSISNNSTSREIHRTCPEHLVPHCATILFIYHRYLLVHQIYSLYGPKFAEWTATPSFLLFTGV